jgi:hypothetical protein
MKLVGGMTAASVLSWLVATAMLGTHIGIEVFLGMIAPLVVATCTWLLIERTYRRHPEQVTSLMVAAFGAKMVFFGAYVAIVLKVLSLRPIPFVVSFAGYFIALHLAEAFCLRRLFAESMR